MPQKKGKGGKAAKKNPQKREVVRKEGEMQQYAMITKNLGNGRLECSCEDQVVRIGVIRGTMRCKVWMGVNDIVLVAKRDFEDTIVDIIAKYNPDDVKELIKDNEIPRDFQIRDEREERKDDVVDFVMAEKDKETKKEAKSGSYFVQELPEGEAEAEDMDVDDI